MCCRRERLLESKLPKAMVGDSEPGDSQGRSQQNGCRKIKGCLYHRFLYNSKVVNLTRQLGSNTFCFTEDIQHIQWGRKTRGRYDSIFNTIEVSLILWSCKLCTAIVTVSCFYFTLLYPSSCCPTMVQLAKSEKGDK